MPDHPLLSMIPPRSVPLWLTSFFIATTVSARADDTARQLTAANGLLARQQYDMARDEFTSLLTTNPTNPDANFGLALTYYSQADYAHAIGPFTLAAKDKNFPRREEALALLGHSYLLSSKYVEAITTFNIQLQDYPTGPQAQSTWVNKAQAYYRLNRPNDAKLIAEAFAKAYPLSPYRAASDYLLALADHDLGQNAAAEKVLTQWLSAYPNHPQSFDAQLLLGQSLEAQHKTADALALYQSLLQNAPEGFKPAAALAVGNAQLAAGNYKEAATIFTDLQQKYPNTTQALSAALQSAIVKLKTNDITAARTTLQSIPPGTAQSTSAAYWLARCDLSDRKFDAAKSALTQLIKLYPDLPERPQAELDIADCDLALAHWQDAASELATFRQHYPQYPQVAEATYRQAYALHQLADYKNAETLLSSIPQLTQDSTLLISATLLRADNHFQQQDLTTADAAYTQLLTQQLTDAQRQHTLLRHGQCAFYRQDYPVAIQILTPALANATDPLVPEATFLLADAHLQSKNYPAAEATFKKYLELTPNQPTDRTPEAHFKLATALTQQNKTTEAIAELTPLTQASSPTPQATPWPLRAHLALANLYLATAQPNLATQSLHAITAAAPQDPSQDPHPDLTSAAYLLLARIAQDQQKYPEALTQYASIIRTYPTQPAAEEALFRTALTLRQSNDLAGAQSTFTQYLRTYPTGTFAQDATRESAVTLSLASNPAGLTQLESLASKKESRTATTLYSLAWAQRRADKIPDALTTYHQLIKEFPKNPQAPAITIELANLLISPENPTPDPPEAIALLQPLITNYQLPITAAARLSLAFAYAASHQPDLALKSFDAFAADYPQDPHTPLALYQSANLLLTAHQFPQATRHLNAILTTYPTTPEASLATLRLGELQNQTADYATALTTFTTFLNTHPHAPSDQLQLAHFGRGWSLENQQHYDDARAAYTQALTGDPTPTAARAQFQIGETYFAQSNFAPAAKELLKVDILYPYPEWSSKALYEAARAFTQLKDPENARTQYTLCIQKYSTTDAADLCKKALNEMTKHE